MQPKDSQLFTIELLSKFQQDKFIRKIIQLEALFVSFDELSYHSTRDDIIHLKAMDKRCLCSNIRFYMVHI